MTRLDSLKRGLRWIAEACFIMFIALPGYAALLFLRELVGRDRFDSVFEWLHDLIAE